MPGKITLEMVFLFSGGKDSCLSIHKLKKDGWRIRALITTVTADYNRVSMHGIRRELVIKQANSMNIPLHIVEIPKDCSDALYTEIMLEKLNNFKKAGIHYVGCGDIFLEDIRKFREEIFKKLNMRGVFPLWNMNTKELANEFINLGFRAMIVCVDTKRLPPSCLGMEINEEFIRTLPPGVDVCGENGEFHSFVYDGPLFKEKINVKKGKIHTSGCFAFLEILPESVS